MIESQHLLYNVSKLFRTKCIDGITVNEKVLAHYMETTVGIVTALNPVLGYEKATELASEAYKSGKGILEVIREKKLLTEEQITELLDPIKLTNLDPTQYQKKRTYRDHGGGRIMRTLRIIGRPRSPQSLLVVDAAALRAGTKPEEAQGRDRGDRRNHRGRRDLADRRRDTSPARSAWTS